MLKQDYQCRRDKILEKSIEVIFCRRYKSRVLSVRKRLVKNFEFDVVVRYYSHLNLINRRLFNLDSTFIMTTNL